MKIVLVVILVFISAACIFSPSVYSLQKADHNSRIRFARDGCTSSMISACDLHAGDILLKRELTDSTAIPSRVYNLHFTHAALYMGNDLILEAKGFDTNKANEISLSHKAATQWVSKEMEDWIVLRPAAEVSTINDVISLVNKYASSPHLKFGFTRNALDDTVAYCSQLIWKIYYEAQYSLGEPYSGIITPDYIFHLASLDPLRIDIAFSR